MGYDYCRACEASHAEGSHLPLWDVWQVDDWYSEERGDVNPTRAEDAQEAVEKWADYEDAQGDYTIVSGSPATVMVARVGSADAQRYIVCGESVPEYTARMVVQNGNEEE